MNRTLAQPPLPSVVAPVASVMRLAKFRPLTGRFSISSGDTLTPIFADVVSMTVTSANGDRLGDVGDGEREVQRLDVADADREVAALRREPGQRRRDLVLARRQVRDDVAALSSVTDGSHGAGLASR